MAEVVLFHHAQGLTPGVAALADELRSNGHTVHTPDLFDGQLRDSIDGGLALAREIGWDEIAARADRAVADLPTEVVYAGISLGVMQAQRLAQTRTGARGAVLLESCAPTSEFGGSWPTGVPVQVHAMAEDPFFSEEGGDVDAARALVEEADDAELFLYPGDQHLFTDRTLPSYRAEPAAQVLERVRAFLDRV